MDEPCSAFDPIATARIEELMDELRGNYTILIVTHSMQQAARVSQRTAFFHLGILVEVGETEQIFTNPREQRTPDYITGRFGCPAKEGSGMASEHIVKSFDKQLKKLDTLIIRMGGRSEAHGLGKE